ncbi:hypothetical protein HPB48_014521 [Haemaphysalis longicornis]|uniref:Uncharacterized protein n=1 Tax=Haemaphysalis longicornis TaxID=44386 RepID=A0A9J6GY04_HAELO|nr:hypothetical protein HPB48_014521 [Haemaphysalis longicornis]
MESQSASGNADDPHLSAPDATEDDEMETHIEMESHIDQDASALGCEAQNQQPWITRYQSSKQAPEEIFASCQTAAAVNRNTNKAYPTPEPAYGVPAKASPSPC